MIRHGCVHCERDITFVINKLTSLLFLLVRVSCTVVEVSDITLHNLLTVVIDFIVAICN